MSLLSEKSCRNKEVNYEDTLLFIGFISSLPIYLTQPHPASPQNERQPVRMWQKQIPSIQTLAAFIVIVVTGHLLCSNTFSSFAFAASTGDENYCAAHDPREECINPNARFDSDDADDGQECFDVESACKYWSRNGECERNPGKKLTS